MNQPETPAAGWYPDPSDPGNQQRWWNGSEWAENTAPAAHTKTALGPAGKPYAGFWVRFLGLIIDSVILAIPTVFLFILFLWPDISAILNSQTEAEITAAAENFDANLSTLLITTVLSIILYFTYYWVGIAKYGRTIGGQLLGIRCVNEDGQNPSWRASAIRSGIPSGAGLLSNLPFVGFVVSLGLLLNYLWMLWDPQKQCLMDKAAKTYVVRV